LIGFGALLGLLGKLPWQSRGTLYEDPQGRYSYRIDPNWKQVRTDGDYAQFEQASPSMTLYSTVVETSDVDDAFVQASIAMGLDPDLLQNVETASLGDWYLVRSEDSAGLQHGYAAQQVGSTVVVFVVRGNEPGINPENPSTLRIVASTKLAGKVETVIESYADLEELVRAQVDGLVGSVSLALVHNGEIVYTYTYGEANPVESIPADANTIYPWGSMSKILTAVAAMQLVEQGKIDLDAWPGEYVPEFPETWHMRVRDLFTDSGCMIDHNRQERGYVTTGDGELPPLVDVSEAYVREFPDLACEPGFVTSYSNPHYLELGRIVEEVSGQSFEDYVTARLLIPLGMESAAYRFDPADQRYARLHATNTEAEQLIRDLNAYSSISGESLVIHTGDSHTTMTPFRVLAPWGGMYSTPTDVAAFLQMHLNGGRYGDAQLLQPETVAAMQERLTALDGSDLGMGLGWWHGEDDFGPFVYHAGSVNAGEALMRVYPEQDVGVVVMGSMVDYRPGKILDALMQAWASEGR
jgi:CubicO group peptidase (beta-lactamase class C family)